MSLKKILVLAIAVVALAAGGSLLGGWIGFLFALITVVLAFIVNSAVGDELRRTLRRLATRMRRPSYSYDLLVRLNCGRLPAVDEVVHEITAFIKVRANGRVGPRGANYVQVQMTSPPEPISIEWHARGESEEELGEDRTNEDQIEDLYTMLVTPAAPHIVDLRALRGRRTEELASVLWELALKLQHAFSGEDPEILITVNRVDPESAPRRPVAPSGHVVQQRMNGASITRGANSLQIFARSVGDAIRHLAKDVVDLEPVSG